MVESRLTINDIALAAGVSVATVSRALRNLPNVAPHTRKKVAEVAAELQYEAHPQASRLASGRTWTVGVVAPLFGTWFPSRAPGRHQLGVRQGRLRPAHLHDDRPRGPAALLTGNSILLQASRRDSPHRHLRQRRGGLRPFVLRPPRRSRRRASRRRRVDRHRQPAGITPRCRAPDRAGTRAHRPRCRTANGGPADRRSPNSAGSATRTPSAPPA